MVKKNFFLDEFCQKWTVTGTDDADDGDKRVAPVAAQSIQMTLLLQRWSLMHRRAKLPIDIYR
jgi:hypothetical protein